MAEATKLYRQCKLHKLVAQGTAIQVAWLPKEYAIIGKILKLNEDLENDNGWVVISVGKTELNTESANIVAGLWRTWHKG